MRVPIFATAWLMLAANLAYAETTTFGGHVKNQITYSDYDQGDFASTLGPERPTSYELDLRANGSAKEGPFEFTAHGEVLGVGGDGLDARRQTFAALTGDSTEPLILRDDRRFFDLTKEISEDENFASVGRLDRLHASYLGEKVVGKVGRQAVSWGNALVFQALDFFNPFSPTEIDRDYKTGDDMAYGQWLFDSGDDVQAVIVPRRDPETHNVKDDESSFVTKYHRRIDSVDVDFDLLAAYHYDEGILGAGLSTAFLEAVWRVDVSITDLNDGGTAVAVIANADRSWVFCGKNVYGFIEYFHSGVGEGDKNYTNVSVDLTERIARGELFTLAKNYVVGGFRFQVTPLLDIYPSNILNLDDQSGFFQLRLEYDWFQNVSVLTGLNLPYGGRGTEYGGFAAAPGTFLGRAEDLYLRVAYYF